jgi:hypothetical protein
MRLVAAILVLFPLCASAQYVGDYQIDDTVRIMWNTFGGDGESITRGTNGTVSWYEDGSTTQSTSGVTDSEDFDSLTGVHLVSIAATAANGFEDGKTYHVVVSGAAVDGQTINAEIGMFTIGKIDFEVTVDAPTAEEVATAVLAAAVGPRTLACVLKALEAVSYGHYEGASSDRVFRSPENDGVTVSGSQTDTTRESDVTCP